ncbi:MAG: manA [Thermomicrobiales bacterium]|nr:manA [Thermomicrobiales bacterium]
MSRVPTMTDRTEALPIKIRPRLDAKPWGGRRLETWGIALPPHEAIGEALLTAPEAIVASGARQGVTLGELARQDPATWVGAGGLAVTGGRPLFPLLIKLIDGHADLSVQVHPDDRAAAAAGLGTGKTEAYYVLAADPGSIIYLGLEPGADPAAFATACRRADGSAVRFLRRIPAKPDMTVLIPAGTPHALGAGIVLYEIQQPSNVTFRLDDWGRRDADGVGRQLHHAEGLALVDPLSRPEPILPIVVHDGAVERRLLVATRYFALERITSVSRGGVQVAAVESPQVLTCIRGTWVVAASATATPLSIGETMILPAGAEAGLAASEPAVVLRGWVPDRERDIAAPARAAGASAKLIRGLAGTPRDTAEGRA